MGTLSFYSSYVARLWIGLTLVQVSPWYTLLTLVILVLCQVLTAFSAVPEPSAFMFGSVVAGIMGTVSRRKRNR